MEIDLRSSSNDLSSVPSSDGERPNHQQPSSSSSHRQDTITVARSHPSTSTQHHSPYGPLPTGLETSAAFPSATRQEAALSKPRKPRKKKEVDPNSAIEKEKKPRKPKGTPNTTEKASKRRKTENNSVDVVLHDAPQSSGLNVSKLVQPTTFASDANSPYNNYEAAKTTQNGFSSHNSTITSQPRSPVASRYETTSQQQQPPPPSHTTVTTTSRDIFDPVRGITRTSSHTHTSTTYVAPNETPPKSIFRPSASPAISSIIHPQDEVDTKYTSGYGNGTSASSKASRQQSIPSRPLTFGGVGKDVISLDSEPEELVKKPATMPEKVNSETESSKPKRAKEAPPPAALGSGLLGAHFFGGGGSGGSAEKTDQTDKGTSIVLQIKLGKPGENVINFARLAEEKYGFAALHPRLAAQRKRMAEVAAAGAALEKSAVGNSNNKKNNGTGADSADEDLSVDIDRDSDNDGDVTMQGVNGTNDNSGTDAVGPKKKRRTRADEYDADDPFVDDSEMLWEAQAAASKDGFFVYCGPLVPEGEKPAVEKADGTGKKGRGGGRGGRGGGPGSRGGGRGAVAGSGSGGGTTAAAAAAAGGRAGGSVKEATPATGARGTGVTRKPRMTKADREQREREKAEREKQAEQPATAKAPVVPA